ncbi:MAG: chromosome partitioning ATPase [Pseudomonadota bacterium]
MSKIQDALKKLQRQHGNKLVPEARVTSVGSIRSEDDESRVMPLLKHDYRGGIVDVDREALRQAGLLATVSEQRRIAEQYRQIKRPLLANASSRKVTEVPRGNLIMVGSAIPGEGKTFTCINLALSIALERDWSVVLVDADCSKPHITHLFGLSDQPGLLDVLRESTRKFNDYVWPTDIPNLALLPAGTQDELASELLSSERMDRLCQQLSTEDQKRILLFDTSPLLYTNESPVISTHVGQVALVVAADRTAQGMVLSAIELLDDSKATNVVLNRSNLRDIMTGEYYGYGYGAKEIGTSDAEQAK